MNISREISIFNAKYKVYLFYEVENPKLKIIVNEISTHVDKLLHIFCEFQSFHNFEINFNLKKWKMTKSTIHTYTNVTKDKKHKNSKNSHWSKNYKIK